MQNITGNWVTGDDFFGRKQESNKLLQRLIDENYIKCRKSCYSFVSPVLKDWWKNYVKWED